MFLPLHDGVPLKNMKTPLATRILIAACTVAYLLTFYGPLGADAVVGGFGFIPSVLFGTEVLPEGFPFVPVELTLATNIFLHGSLFHLIGNMLFFWVFGDNVEDAMGHLRFILFFLLCGTAASLAHAFITAEPHRPLIGASGGVSGVVAAYWTIGFWFVLQFASAFLGGDESVGWFAHLGGFVVGAILIPFMRRRYDPVIARVQAQELQAPR
jgi:membrane associated rhomboid family serine protease